MVSYFSMKPSLAKNFKIVLVSLLVGITMFSVFKYLVALKEKHDLLKSLNEVREQVATLEQTVVEEKKVQDALSQENVALKTELKTNTDKFAQIDADFKNAQATIEQLTAQIAISKAENTALREEKDKAAQDLTRISQERDDFKSRLSSIPELKKAIKEVKIQLRQAKKLIREVAKTRMNIEGNGGFMIKNGKSTFPATGIKIEVTPAPTSK
jgi:chromosome segregation ATPase